MAEKKLETFIMACREKSPILYACKYCRLFGWARKADVAQARLAARKFFIAVLVGAAHSPAAPTNSNIGGGW